MDMIWQKESPLTRQEGRSDELVLYIVHMNARELYEPIKAMAKILTEQNPNVLRELADQFPDGKSQTLLVALHQEFGR